jgi:hypothetical protein
MACAAEAHGIRRIGSVRADGAKQEVHSGLGVVDPSLHFSPADDDAAIIKQIRGTVVAFGPTIALKQLRVLHPYGPAVLVVITVPGPDDVDDAMPLMSDLDENRLSYEGFYFEVDDRAGAPLADVASAFAAGSGGQWAADNQYLAPHG